MGHNKIQYPHPVLDELGEDFRECEFLIKVECVNCAGRVLVCVELELRSEGISSAIERGSAVVGCMLECNRTLFREITFAKEKSAGAATVCAEKIFTAEFEVDDTRILGNVVISGRDAS